MDQRALIRKYEAELQSLRKELEGKNKSLIDKSHFMKLEEEKKQAEKDKFEAQAKLEAKIKEFHQEKLQKESLEVKFELSKK